MSKLNNKLILLLLSFLSLILLNSCSYETTTINLGSGFDSTWTFSNSSDYEFDENLVEVVNGKAQLKVLDLEHSGEDFISGSHVGSGDANETLSLRLKNSLENNPTDEVLSDNNQNLVGYWKFDGNLTDESTFSNNGSISGAGSIHSSAKVGSHSFLFNGTDSLIEVLDSGSLDLNQLTSCLWVYPNSLPANDKTLVAKSPGIYEPYRIVLRSDLSVQLQVSESISTRAFLNSSPGVVPLNQWSHLCFSFNDSDQMAKIYLNGALLVSGTSAVTSIFSTTGDLSIGGSLTRANQFFDGFIDELALWDSPFPDSEIRRLYENQSQHYTELSSMWTPQWDNIVGYWKMDGNWQDSSGNGNHALNPNGAIFSSDSQVGNFSGEFDGVNQYANISSFNIGAVAEMSLSTWIKLNDPNGGGLQGISYKANVFDVFVVSGSLNFYIVNGSPLHLSSSTSPFNDWDTWHHLVFTYDGSRTVIYRDGELVSVSGVESGNLPSLVSSMQLGFQSSGQYIDGQLDDVALFDKSLNSSDVLEIFNRQKQKYAGHYDSEVIDLGSTAANWPDLSWSTSIPFGKELVGDFDSDGNPDSESSSDYIDLNGNLNNGLVSYWSFNELLQNTIGGDDNEDKSINSNHGVVNGGVNLGMQGMFNHAVSFDGIDDYIEVTDSPSFEFGTDVNMSFSAWVKGKDTNNGVLISKSGNNLNTFTVFAHNTAGGPRALLNHVGIGFCTVDASRSIMDGEWHHLTFVYDRDGSCTLNNIKIYIDGILDTGRTLQSASAGASNFNITNTNNILIGRRLSGSFFSGSIDELKVWNRTLSESEVRQLYRRGANRVKLQVKSCVDSSCNCKSYGAGGSETDCDGDGTLNATDNDDTHKSAFIGPGGDGTTYYSEAFNRTNTEVTFNCALNITDSDAGVCAPDEISFSSGPKPTGPEFLNIDYTQFVTPPANRYAQYRVYMEADENIACGGEPCLPELTSVSLNPTGATKYSSEYIKIKPKSPITFTKLISAEIDAENCVTFRLSRSNTEYYFDGSNWVPATTDTHRNPASVVESNLTKFARDHGVGELEVSAYLASDASQSTQCSVNSIDVKYE